jgi:N-acetylneuraminic acid mutarotase
MCGNLHQTFKCRDSEQLPDIVDQHKKWRKTMNTKRTFIESLIPFILCGLFVTPSLSTAEDGIWTKKADIPTQRWGLAAAVADGKIYVIGGSRDINGGAISTVEEYDPATDRWIKKADMPTARIRASACAVNGKIYVIGGAPNNDNGPPLDAVEEYDPQTDKWTRKAKMPTARHGLAVGVVGGKIYAIGGGKGSVGWKNAVALSPAPVEVYNPTTDKWEKKKNLPTPRFELDAGVVRERIYVVGGARDNATVLDAVEEYDPPTDSWVAKAHMPTARYLHTISVWGDKIFAIGGGVPTPGWWNILLTVEGYDPQTDSWEKKTDMPTPRTDLSSGAVDGKVYVFGGWAGADGLALVEEYAPDGIPFAVSPKNKLTTVWGTIKQPAK